MAGTGLVPAFMSAFLTPKSRENIGDRGMAVFGCLFQVTILFAWFIPQVWEEDDIDNKGTCENLWNSVFSLVTDSPNSTEREKVGLRNIDRPLVEMLHPKWAWITAIPISLFLVSLTWWQNFVGDKQQPGMCSNFMRKVAREVREGQTKLYAIVNIWKAVFIFGCVLLMFGLGVLDEDLRIEDLFMNSNFTRNHEYKDNGDMNVEADWLIAYGVHAGTCLLGYMATRAAIQASVQKETFSVAMTLVTPVSACLGIWLCYRCDNEWNLVLGLPNNPVDVDVFWNCFSGHDGLWLNPIFLIGIVWWVSQVFVSRYIWNPKVEPLADTSR